MNPPVILFQDQRFVVLDKPAGLPVHPGSAGGSSVEDWFPLLSRRRDGPWLAHRLDTDTAGCLAIALRKTPLIEAQTAFAQGRVAKTYWAVVRGGPAEPAGTLDAPLLRQDANRQWRMIVDPAGLPAITEWRVMGTGADAQGPLSWLELRPKTGRTHQIRAHCAHLGCPILGDPHYGGRNAGEGRLHLLARAIAIPLDPPVAAVAEPPAHMRSALALCA